jgi:hypothetical protein
MKLLLFLILLAFVVVVVVYHYQRTEHFDGLPPENRLPLWMPTTFRRSRNYQVPHPCLDKHTELFPWVESTLDPNRPIHYHPIDFNGTQVRRVHPGDLDGPEVYGPKRLWEK